MSSASSQNIAFAQENQGRVKCAGSLASTLSCIHPVPPVLSISMRSAADFSAGSIAVRPATATAIGQT